MIRTALLALGAFSALFAETYQIDSGHSSAQFTVRHLMVSNVRGAFSKLTGSVDWDAKNPGASKVQASIDAATINTNEPKRDDHLRSADFFDVAKYPTIKFQSKQVSQSGGNLVIKGDLTMHGVTKEVTLTTDGMPQEIKDQRGGYRLGASASGMLKRSEWGLTWNRVLEAGGVSVSDEVKLTLDIEATRK